MKGVYQLLRTEHQDANENQINTNKNHVFSVAGVTFSNGGDNIGIYTPLFATLSWTDKTVMITVFLVMTLLWCMAAVYFTKHPLVARAIDKYGHVLTPFVLILLGIYILYEANSIELLVRVIR
jgi:cadmium resistance protein CadD (predicted permease)